MSFSRPKIMGGWGTKVLGNIAQNRRILTCHFCANNEFDTIAREKLSLMLMVIQDEIVSHILIKNQLTVKVW